ncbi:hypothetical protein OG373_18890 [Streptomyces avidinii]|uniref:hypothetical protein n=1 Tax=Streptomyces avidinii TaxID=1895 RepID=UPI00386FF5F9|nr:hypothetical protein OG373_18890 [Streptomyces avidinii]
MVISLLAASCSESADHDGENDRQRCERTSSQSDTVRFGDCKGLFPGQPGISGWD